MPLDAADFISELDINSPAGTEPINQGDDQIRTAKRTQLNSFPLIGGAVSIDHNQMNQMAIKNEANTFTQINTFGTTTLFDGHLRATNGAAATPVYSFQNDTGMGMYRESASFLALAVGGVRQARISTNAFQFFQQILMPVGSVSAPAITFTGDGVTGFYQSSLQVLNAAAGGVQVWNATSGRLRSFVPWQAVDGSVAAPQYAFTSEPQSGMFLGAAGSLWFGTNNRTRLKLSDTGRNSFLQGSATLGVSLSLESNTSIVAYSIDYEGTAGFQPGQFSISRFNRTTGAFIDIPLYINATTGRVHSKLPILTP